jgi:hypothetical protein
MDADEEEIGQLAHKKSDRVRRLRDHEMTRWDRPGNINQPRTEWDKSPAQLGESLPELPSVPEEIDWSEYAAYKCRHCSDDCLNLRGTIPTETQQCWSCLRIPSLDRDDGSYIEALVELKVAYRLGELDVDLQEELRASEAP